MSEQYKIYIVVSQTGTLVSRIIKFVTKDEYNHSSLSLNKELTDMYSFGRKYAHLPLPGGFVQEDIHKKVFAAHPNTRLIVCEIPITKEQYRKLVRTINHMKQNQKIYSYNLIGLILAAFHQRWQAKNKYYCSEFVKYLLIKSNIVGENELPKICKPIEFKNINGKVIFEGKMREYSYA